MMKLLTSVYNWDNFYTELILDWYILEIVGFIRCKTGKKKENVYIS